MFAPNAVENILKEVMHYPDADKYDPAWLDVFAKAFRKQEIYCPHEGIDRRTEFGL